MEWKQGEFTVSDCRENLDVELIYHFLNSLSYWAKDIPSAASQLEIRVGKISEMGEVV
jgi:hypothetical protein